MVPPSATEPEYTLGDVATFSSQPTQTRPLAVAGRVVSVDIFRGLTIAVLIFVNELADVKGLPWWTYHMLGNVSGMTYVDVAFPAFLFTFRLVSERRNLDGKAEAGLASIAVIRVAKEEIVAKLTNYILQVNVVPAMRYA